MTIQALGNTVYNYATTVSGYSPYSSQPVATDNGSGTPSAMFATDFTSISSMVAHAGGGGFAAFKLSGQMGDSIKTLFGHPPAPAAPPAGGGAATAGFAGNLMTGLKGVAITGLKGAGLSALVSAGVSVVANGVGAATGKIDSSKAVTNVVKDTIGGAVGGLTAVTAGGIGSIAMGAMHIGGLPATIITVGLGAVGGVLGGELTKKLTDKF